VKIIIENENQKIKIFNEKVFFSMPFLVGEKFVNFNGTSGSNRPFFWEMRGLISFFSSPKEI
jgi:hypothetical protein